MHSPSYPLLPPNPDCVDPSVIRSVPDDPLAAVYAAEAEVRQLEAQLEAAKENSGLESYVAHTRGTFNSFLPLSIDSFAATTLPYALAAFRKPADVAVIDDAFDAALVCTVGRRASTAQGRALLAVWEKSFLPAASETARVTLAPFCALMKTVPKFHRPGDIPRASGHLAPVFGCVSRLVGLPERQAAYVFVLAHVKALLSAAVRANMFGPFQAQKVLASTEVLHLVNKAIDREVHTPYEKAGQTVPVMDLWMGRHELLYSRIFNS
ncbi:putative urease accessory protein UreF [Ceratocystis fimbriata CBS 114723]|uniref:Putative urease accessory protein UreF n=1 Tax=Ceratocystis fimbriata CBS 114723 TaxID=1035309 RepID=A0A2C5XIE5_9PEZI|nr:putative urease accessory protein UreF [Ceratocystis fimbriata CBS 114723]